jgi:hypothetical protein
MSSLAAFALVISPVQRNMAMMHRIAVTALGLAFLAPAGASAQVTQAQLAYDTYAAGIEVMQMQAHFGLGPWNYRLDLDYHTTGLVGVFYRGRQTNTVRGTWDDDQAMPAKFFGEGVWRGHERRTLIDYDHGLPQVKELQPPQETEREPVPLELRRHTIDTLSALAQLMRRVEHDHTCETEVRTYDGRRVLDVVAHTGGPERLDPTGRSCSAKMTPSTARRCTDPPGWPRCCRELRRFQCVSASRPAGLASPRCTSPARHPLASLPTLLVRHINSRVAVGYSGGFRKTHITSPPINRSRWSA